MEGRPKSIGVFGKLGAAIALAASRMSVFGRNAPEVDKQLARFQQAEDLKAAAEPKRKRRFRRKGTPRNMMRNRPLLFWVRHSEQPRNCSNTPCFKPLSRKMLKNIAPDFYRPGGAGYAGKVPGK